jgi:histidinol-phosphate/aromatic aminotransferase/cobyric acid decarboxylase-like protein/GNAT superfamily N-acetyltransferase
LRVSIEQANASDRDAIARLRHQVYALEIHQHHSNGQQRLTDDLDAWNTYLVARDGDTIAGFVSITPPNAPRFSIDKYFSRTALPVSVDARTYEVRLLTVLPQYRGRTVAFLLMYGVLRWIEARGGNMILAIGRREVLPMYLDSGLQGTGLQVASGDVTYELMFSTTETLRAAAVRQAAFVDRLERTVSWQLPVAFRKPAACFHGGAFFDAVGAGFKTLERAREIINADVLDAWFDPAPSVVDTLQQQLPWLLKTSPPTACEGLIQAIATARGVSVDNVVVGSGSSDLIFRALPRWLTRSSRVLLLDPTYGEYAHVLEQVIGCGVDRLALARQRNYEAPLDVLANALSGNYELVVLVNPNSPTGRHIDAEHLKPLLRQASPQTRIWVDETYVDYVGGAQSLEVFAAASENVIVCKSMSKAYALSGVRAAYLCAGAHQLEEIRSLTPPWVVSLPAQVAAVRAMESPTYYLARWTETIGLRHDLAAGLRDLGWDVVDGVANFLLCHLPDDAPTAADLVAQCRERGLFLRNASPMGRMLGDRAVRITVKDAATNARMLAVLRPASDKGR